jgi:hypothetical protein
MFVLSKAEFDCIHCHDLETLPLGYLVSVLRRTRVVYDAHELEIGRERRERLRRPIMVLERLLLRRCRQVIAANKERLQCMNDLYDLEGLDTHVIRNFSDAHLYNDPPDARAQDLDGEAIWLSLVGSIAESRPYGPFIEALGGNPHIRVFYFGRDGRKITEIARLAGVEEQIHDCGVVERRTLLATLKLLDGAVAAFSLTPENYQYCESNRVFDALCCGCFVIGTRNPSLLFLEEMQVGFNVAPSVSDIASVYGSLDRPAVDELKTRVRDLGESFSWEANENVLLQIYGHGTPQ